MRTLVVATKNDKKLRELRRYLKGIKAHIISLKEMAHAPRIREDKNTLCLKPRFGEKFLSG